MKNAFLILLLASYLGAFGQQYQYSAFPKEKGYWKYSVHDDYWNQYGWYYIQFDVDTSGIVDTMYSSYGAYYEMNKQVFYRKWGNTQYHLLYDFSLSVGDTFVYRGSNMVYPGDTIGVVAYDDTINGTSFSWPNRRSLGIKLPSSIGTPYQTLWVEGIGNVGNPFDGFLTPFFTPSISGGIRLQCVYHDSISSPCQDAFSLELESYTLNELHYYPNPVSDNLFIEHNVREPIDKLRIYGRNGQEVFGDVDNSIGLIQIDMTKLSTGIYFVLVSTLEKAQILKIQKE